MAYITNFPNGLSAWGQPLTGPGRPQIPAIPSATSGGHTWFVDATNGTTGNDGTGPDSALATIQAAVNKCNADKGDTIYVYPGTYAENVTITSKGGISIVACRKDGNLARPAIAPAAGSGLVIRGSQRVTVTGLKMGGVGASAFGLDTDSRGGHFEDCEFTADTTADARLKPDATVSTTNDASGVRFINCIFSNGGGKGLQTESAATSNANATDVYLEGCRFYGNTGEDIFDIDTGATNHTADKWNLQSCQFNGRNKATYIQLNAGSLNANNLIANAVFNVSGFLTTTHVKLTNNSSLESSFPDSGVGSTYVLKKTVVSSTITFAAPVDLTTVSTDELLIENIVVKSDSVGLATGTNFQIISNNAKGLATILVETVANLNANKTVDLFTASLVKQRTVLEAGAKFQVQNTVANGTGAGTVDIYLYLKRLAPLATVT